MERKAATVITTKAAFTKEPKWTIVMAKNVCQVVSFIAETLVDAQTGGAQTQPTPHGLQGQGGRDQERFGAMAQHRTTVRPDEVMRQGCCHHVALACHCAGLRPNGGRALRRGATQVYDEQRLPSCVTSMQGLGGDQVRPGQGPHTRTTGTQARAMAVIQRGRGGGKRAF